MRRTIEGVLLFCCVSAYAVVKGKRDLWEELIKDPKNRLKDASMCILDESRSHALLCDPDKILSKNQSAEMLGAIKSLETQRIHKCSNGIDKPILVTLVLSSDAGSHLNVPEDEYAEQLLERILEAFDEQAGNHLKYKAPKTIPFCGFRLAIYVNLFRKSPLLVFRCESSLEPLFLEDSYPAIHATALEFLTAENEHDSLVRKKLINLMAYLAKLFPIKKASDENDEEQNEAESTMKDDSWVNSVSTLEEYLAEMILRRSSKKHRGTIAVERAVIKRSIIRIAIVFLAWSAMMEVLRQIILRRFTPSKDAQPQSYGGNLGYTLDPSSKKAGKSNVNEAKIRTRKD